MAKRPVRDAITMLHKKKRRQHQKPWQRKKDSQRSNRAARRLPVVIKAIDEALDADNRIAQKQAETLALAICKKNVAIAARVLMTAVGKGYLRIDGAHYLRTKKTIF